MAKFFKKPRWTTPVFYGVLLIVIIAFFLFMSGLMDKLNIHLEKYQASHINTQYRKVFDQHFSQPDWGKLYGEAGLEDTPYEGKEAFIAYMEEKVGDQELICFLESAGTDSKKCPVYLGNEEIGAFYMTSPPEDQPETDPWYYKIPFAKSLVNKLKVQNWTYDGLTLVQPKRELSVSVTTEGERIVYVNGVALTHAQLTSTTETLAEQYLPEGLHGMRRQSFYEDGFLVKPEVTATDLAGNPIALTEISPGMYTETFTPQEMDTDMQELIIDAAKVYCQYMINATEPYSLSFYFDTSSQLYRNIVYTELWMQNYQTYRFAEPVVSDFYRYSDDTVSIRIVMSLFVRRYDGTEKEYPLDTTYFLKKQENGKYKIFSANNMDLQQTTTLVRLRFFVDGQMVDSQMVDITASQLTLPQVEAPEGKHFTGWYQSTTAEDGSQSLSLVFLPKDGENTVFIPADTDLTVMDLQALFE